MDELIEFLVNVTVQLLQKVKKNIIPIVIFSIPPALLLMPELYVYRPWNSMEGIVGRPILLLLSFIAVYIYYVTIKNIKIDAYFFKTYFKFISFGKPLVAFFAISILTGLIVAIFFASNIFFYFYPLLKEKIVYYALFQFFPVFSILSLFITLPNFIIFLYNVFEGKSFKDAELHAFELCGSHKKEIFFLFFTLLLMMLGLNIINIAFAVIFPVVMLFLGEAYVQLDNIGVLNESQDGKDLSGFLSEEKFPDDPNQRPVFSRVRREEPGVDFGQKRSADNYGDLPPGKHSRASVHPGKEHHHRHTSKPVMPPLTEQSKPFSSTNEIKHKVPLATAAAEAISSKIEKLQKNDDTKMKEHEIEMPANPEIKTDQNTKSESIPGGETSTKSETAALKTDDVSKETTKPASSEGKTVPENTKKGDGDLAALRRPSFETSAPSSFSAFADDPSSIAKRERNPYYDNDPKRHAHRDKTAQKASGSGPVLGSDHKNAVISQNKKKIVTEDLLEKFPGEETENIPYIATASMKRKDDPEEELADFSSAGDISNYISKHGGHIKTSSGLLPENKKPQHISDYGFGDDNEQPAEKEVSLADIIDFSDEDAAQETEKDLGDGSMEDIYNEMSGIKVIEIFDEETMKEKEKEKKESKSPLLVEDLMDDFEVDDIRKRKDKFNSEEEEKGKDIFLDDSSYADKEIEIIVDDDGDEDGDSSQTKKREENFTSVDDYGFIDIKKKE